jgi:hypothetical protein
LKWFEFLTKEKPNCAIDCIGLIELVTYRDFLQFFWQTHAQSSRRVPAGRPLVCRPAPAHAHAREPRFFMPSGDSFTGVPPSVRCPAELATANPKSKIQN